MPAPHTPESPARPTLNQPTGWKARLKKYLRKLFELRNLYLIKVRLRFAPTEAQLLFGLTVLIGLLSGLAAVAFHLAIKAVEHTLINPATHAHWPWMVPATVLVPTLGALLCGALLVYLAPNARGSPPLTPHG